MTLEVLRNHKKRLAPEEKQSFVDSVPSEVEEDAVEQHYDGDVKFAPNLLTKRDRFQYHNTRLLRRHLANGDWVNFDQVMRFIE